LVVDWFSWLIELLILLKGNGNLKAFLNRLNYFKAILEFMNYWIVYEISK